METQYDPLQTATPLLPSQVHTRAAQSKTTTAPLNSLARVDTHMWRLLSLSWSRNSPPFMGPTSITAFWKPRQWTLSCSSWIQSTPYYIKTNFKLIFRTITMHSIMTLFCVTPNSVITLLPTRTNVNGAGVSSNLHYCKRCWRRFHLAPLWTVLGLLPALPVLMLLPTHISCAALVSFRTHIN